MKYSSYRLGSQSVARSRFGRLKLSVTESVWSTGNFGPRWSTNFFTTQKTTNLRMECSHECARKACVRVPHAQDLTYEALND